MEINSLVEDKYDPSRRGVITHGPRLRRLDGAEHRVWHVQWHDGRNGWRPESSLRPAPETPPDAFDLLQEGRFCGPSELRRNITFCQVAGNVDNLVYSMDATNIDFLPYQYAPVLRFLASPSNGILIADEVGLGKTIEAGLIWTELRARSDARRLVVVCPATLRDKWELELENKFGVSARQVDAEGLRKELDAPKYRALESQALICSIQGIRGLRRYEDPTVSSPAARLARFLEERAGRSSIIDLLVVDEAHHLRNPGTQSARIGALLRDVSEHVVLLSATPVNNKEEDLFHLLRLVDPDTFSSPDIFPSVLDANEPLVRARRLVMDRQSQPTRAKVVEVLRQALTHELLRGNRRLRGIIDSIDDESLADPSFRVELANRIDGTNLLRTVLSRTRKREVQELVGVEREAYRPEVKMPEGGVEEEFYRKVTTSIRRYAISKDVGAGFLLVMPQRLMSSCMYAAAKSWATGISDDEVAQPAYESGLTDGNELKESAAPLMQHIATDLKGFDYHQLRDHDTKFTTFCDWLLIHMTEYPNDKVIVFSYFKATLAYLAERLAEHNVHGQVLHGGLTENKQRAIDKFRRSSDKVLLTSEVASEGVDLQFSRCIVNYDLPWNPMRIEQRIGRIDRIGQKSPKVLIVNMVYGDTIDDRIYTVLLEKIGIFERAIGGMEVILGKLVRELTVALIRKDLTKEEEEKRIEETAIAIAARRRQEDELEEQAIHLVALEEYVLHQVKEAHDFKRRITSRDLTTYAGDYLDRHAGEPFEFQQDPSEPRCVEIKLPPKLRGGLMEHIRNERLPSRTSLTEGHLRPYVFSHKIAHRSHRRERITQFHPFIRFIGSQLKPSFDEFCPLIALRLRSDHVEDPCPVGDYAFALRRWRFGGGRPVDELRARSVFMGDEDVLDPDRSWKLVSAGKRHGMEWRTAKLDVDVDWADSAFHRCQAQLDEDYERVHLDRKHGNDDRIDLQVTTLKRRAARRLARLQEVLQLHREYRRKGLALATEARMDNIRERRDTEVAQRESKRGFTSRSEEMCLGVIRVLAKGDE